MEDLVQIGDEDESLCDDCICEPKIRGSFRKLVQFSEFNRSCSSSVAIGTLPSGLNGCMPLRCKSTPVQSHMNAEDDYIISRRSSQIRMQKHANSPFLPPPGKFAKAASLPNMLRRPIPAESAKHLSSSPAPFLAELSTSIQVFYLMYQIV